MSKYEGIKELVIKVQSAKEPLTDVEIKKYNNFMKEISLMLDEVPHIVGHATLSYFWNELHRIDTLERLK